MSVYNLKSEVLRNRDASPAVLTNPEQGQGNLKSAIGVQRTSESGASLGAAGSKFLMFQIPSNARLDRFEYAVGDIETSSLDIAVWYPTDIPQGGENAPAASLAATLISSSAFAAAISGVDGGGTWTSAYKSAPAINQAAQPLWLFLGLSNDPGIELDVGFSVRTAVTTNGYVGLRASYVD